MAAGQEPGGVSAVQKQISFGTTQERKMFPYHHAPDRLGIQVMAVGGNPLVGPGSYLGQETTILKSSLSTRPMSSRGYVMGARTGPRFMPRTRTVTPGPAAYEPFHMEKRRCQPAHAPFSSSTPRFPTKPPDREFFPGPGTYNPEQSLNKKVTWPMKFGAPDWSSVPKPPKRMVKREVQQMIMDREFRKHQERLAYLKLFYS
ncbi:ciliary microtubule-associated protein 3 [Pithys albifrons albifrons]|uniref:ciliary microtubule-associated protein 3 n=1 Tax=Pithys albifrons albifrons TaxID=3385563 RepID=UPI003A5D0BF2